MRTWLAAIAMVVPAAMAMQAYAREIKPTKLEVVPNFNTASVYAFFEGDARADLKTTMEYRAGDEKDFHEGHPLSRTGTNRLAGSIFWLKPSEPLEVRVTFDVGGKKNTVEARTRTRSEKFPAGSGKAYYVGPQGDDNGPGTRDKPFKTIQHAVDVVEPGDTILLAVGEHNETVTVKRSGRADAYITLACEGSDATDDKAVPHAFPTIAGGQAVAGPWTRVEERLFVTDLKGEPNTVLLDGKRIYHHVKLDDLKTAAAPIDVGWFHDAKAGKFYVRMPADTEPKKGQVTAGMKEIGLSFVNCGYWIVKGLRFEQFGGRYSHAIDIENSHNIVVQGCNFGHMLCGIWLRKTGSKDCLIERCKFRDDGIWRWPWKSVKAHDTEGNAINFQGGGGNVARFNDIAGQFNGIGASTWGDLENESLNRDLDIHDNAFTEIGDDPMEPEGACMNVRYWNNRTFDTLQGISIAPITVGPVYITRDRYVNFRQDAIKVDVNTRGPVFVYHVLGWTGKAGGEGGNVMGASGKWDNMHFRNTILRGTRYIIEDYFPHPIGCSFDYCDFFTTNPRLMFKWNRQRFDTLDACAKGIPGFGTHNIAVEPYSRGPAASMPASAPAGATPRPQPDLRSLLGEPAPELKDAGVRIPGVNDDFKGKAPDIGPDEN
ncbi:MAG: right-handed parallel beta-helix repeat-containing protein [Phycisphaerae bacterium]